MNVVFRVDSSTIIGTGHLMRCLTLAEELRYQGAGVSFICRDLPGNISRMIRDKGYKVYLLPFPVNENGYDVKYNEMDIVHNQKNWLYVNWRTDAEQTLNIIKKNTKSIEWLIVDHYAIGKQWEKALRPYVKKIMVIDDLADRAHDCDLLLDQNYYTNMHDRYSDLVPKHCYTLLGPKYALLRKEFYEVRKHLKKRNGYVKRILVFFGGSDPTNDTLKAIEAINLLKNKDIIYDVVVGSSNLYKDEVRRICCNMSNVNYYCQIENMAKLMEQADLSIGAGGSSTWERCSLGLPALIIAVASNQELIAQTIDDEGLGFYLGRSKNVKSKKIYNYLKNIISSPNILSDMREKALYLVDGKGVQRVNNTMLVLGE
ncbi:UDP-2,4-diacetamido-2,4,6-trideoxy-beta-L-altropyranose hydrolase [Peptococcaceae bacterium 1198_IL3148]